MANEQSPVSKELNDLGFVTSKLRRGIIIGFMALLVIPIIVLWFALKDANNKIQKINENLQGILIDIIKEQNKTNAKADTLFKKIN